MQRSQHPARPKQEPKSCAHNSMRSAPAMTTQRVRCGLRWLVGPRDGSRCFHGHAKEKCNDDQDLKINLVTINSDDYEPALELAAERWEDLDRGDEWLPHRIDGSADGGMILLEFWRAFAPYVNRSSLLRRRFLEYCEDESVVLLTRPELVALSQSQTRQFTTA